MHPWNNYVDVRSLLCKTSCQLEWPSTPFFAGLAGIRCLYPQASQIFKEVMLSCACEAMWSEYPYPQRKKDDCSTSRTGRKGQVTTRQLWRTAEEKLQFPSMLLAFSIRLQWTGLVVHHLIKIKIFPRIKIQNDHPHIQDIIAYKYYFKIVYDL